MTAALSHLEQLGSGGMARGIAQGAKDAGCVFWYGAAEEEEIRMLAGTGADMIEIIKPYANRDLILQKISQAESIGLLAVGIDIDHPFANDGSPDIVDGEELKALTTSELAEIVNSTRLPLITKGVLSLYDAENSLNAGARGMVLSHHNNRIDYAIPPLYVLPEILKLTGAEVPVFVDCMIQTGMDAFKALALGAKAVLIGRPFVVAAYGGQEAGIAAYVQKLRNELADCMAMTGCATLADIDRSCIYNG
jgi:isopentenyl diphosphate isomerase/L-lactate dehydrogenase-like FMN-dependent dehydrogenase